MISSAGDQGIRFVCSMMSIKYTCVRLSCCLGSVSFLQCHLLTFLSLYLGTVYWFVFVKKKLYRIYIEIVSVS